MYTGGIYVVNGRELYIIDHIERHMAHFTIDVGISTSNMEMGAILYCSLALTH